MRLTALFILTAGPVAAHPGHIVDAAGHNHWVGGILLGATGIAAVIGILKGRKGKKDAEREPEAEAA